MVYDDDDDVANQPAEQIVQLLLPPPAAYIHRGALPARAVVPPEISQVSKRTEHSRLMMHG